MRVFWPFGGFESFWVGLLAVCFAEVGGVFFRSKRAIHGAEDGIPCHQVAAKHSPHLGKANICAMGG